jgi:hypothetical protein
MRDLASRISCREVSRLLDSSGAGRIYGNPASFRGVIVACGDDVAGGVPCGDGS